MSMRSVLVDGAPVARIGDVVKAIEPLDDGRHAWILAYWQTYCPMWRAYYWSLDDGALLDIEAGEGTGAGLAVRAGRVFITGQSWQIRWLDLRDGAHGAVPIEHGHDFAGCSPDGRYLVTEHQGEGRVMWARIHRVDGAGEPFPEVRAPVELSDDGRFAVHFSEDGRSLVRISLGDRTIASLPVDAPAPRWIGLRAVRGAPRVVAWDGAHLVVVDLVTASVVAGVAVERLQSVDDATVERVVVSHGPLQHELLELASGRRLPLSGGTRPPVLTPDGGRCLRHSSHVLDVIDTATGAVFRPHRGHRDTIRDLVWSRDGTRVATAADDGRIRVLHLGDPGAITELVTHRGKLDFTPDGRHLCTVSSSEIAVWDAATGAVLGRCPSFGTHIHSAEVSADGRRVLTGSYSHGIRVVDLATGAHVVIEREATARCTHAVFVGDHIVACGRERVDTLSPVDLVHWTLLDERGLVLDRGGWQLEGRRFNGIEVCFGDATAVVTAYQHAVHEMHTFDLSDPTAAARVVSIPRGAKVLDVRNGRVLLRDVSDLVCLDAATGAELERMHCVRKPWAASLSRDGSHIAVAYTDQGVEVLEMLEAPEVPEAR